MRFADSLWQKEYQETLKRSLFRSKDLLINEKSTVYTLAFTTFAPGKEIDIDNG